MTAQDQRERIQCEFSSAAISHGHLTAKWYGLYGKWELYWAGPDGILIPKLALDPEDKNEWGIAFNGGEPFPAKVLTSYNTAVSELDTVAGKALTYIQPRDAESIEKPWIWWLDYMRDQRWRGFLVKYRHLVSKRLWDAGVKFGRPPDSVQTELDRRDVDDGETQRRRIEDVLKGIALRRHNDELESTAVRDMSFELPPNV